MLMRAERKEAAMATIIFASTWGTPSMIAKPTAAAKTAGMLMRKDNLNAASPLFFLKSSIDVVIPDREIPGIAAKP